MKFRIILPPVGGLFSQLHMGICILIKETNLEDVEAFNLIPSSIYINKKDNYNSLDFWDKIYANIPNLKLNHSHLNTDSKTLIEKSKNYLERIKKNNNN